jgi:hypothetical protein
LKNFEMYAPSVAGNSKIKGKITIDNINNIWRDGRVVEGASLESV